MTKAALLLLGLLLAVAGCGSTVAVDGAAPQPPYVGPSTKPTAVPPAPGLVTTRVPVTVIQVAAGRPELCVGAVMDSLPPQCGGPPLVGWDWTTFPGDYQTLGTTTFGDFLVTGTFDGTRVTPTQVVPAADVPTPTSDPSPLFTTPCPEPSGGWIVDPDKVTDDDERAAFRTAAHLDDYGDSYVDTSAAMAPGHSGGMFDTSVYIINVQVTGDPEAAAEAVRSVWGGGLCVTTTSMTAGQLTRIKNQTEDVPGWLGSGSSVGHVDVTVLYDAGQTQAWADATFGPGIVQVTSALTDAPR